MGPDHVKAQLRGTQRWSALTVFAYVGCALIWGTTWFAIRVCIAPGGYPPFAGAAIRFALATAILAALAAMGLAGRGPACGRQWGWVAAAGVVCGLAYALVYAGEARISGGVAAVIFGTLPPVTVVSTLLAGFERPRPAFLVGSVVALGGIAVLYADRMGASANQATGVALVFASVFLTAIYNLILKRHASGTNPLATNIPFLGASAVTLSVFALALERQAPPWPPPGPPSLALLYLVIFGSIAAFSLYFYLLRHVSLTAASTLLFVEPVLALLIDAAWEREIRLGMRAYAGAAMTLVGLAITLSPRKARAGDH